VTAGNESSGVRFSVGPQNAYDITGNIIDSAESGGARRYVLMLAGRAGGGSVSTATANADGSFAMRGVPSGDYILTAQAIQSAPAAPGGAPLAQRAMNSGATTVRVAEGDARVNVQIGQSSEVAGRVIVENSTGQSVSGIRVGLLSRMSVSAIPSGNYINATDQNGAFKIQNVPTGNYFFSLNARGGLYLKQVACSGRDYTFQPLTMESGVTVGDCVLTLGTDIGAIKGQVLDGGKPVPNLIVLAIPQLSSLRQMARYTVTGNTNENGEFQISNVIPSDYLVFAVPQDDEQSYFQIEFADRRQQDAERVTVKAGETKGIQLKPGTTQ